MTVQDEKRGVDEAYQVAGNTSDLRAESDVRNDADLLIAAGWSESRVGIALLRLHSEWDRAEKPRKPTPELIAALADEMPRIRPANFVMNAQAMDRHWKAEPAQRLVAARKQAQEWYLRELAKLVNKLKSLPDVRRELLKKVSKWSIDDVGDKVPQVIAYWLDQTCHRCNGLKFLKAAGAPSLSARMCPPPESGGCGGTGIAPVPHSFDGRRIASYMDDCVRIGRQSLKRNLSATREPSLHKRGTLKAAGTDATALRD